MDQKQRIEALDRALRDTRQNDRAETLDDVFLKGAEPAWQGYQPERAGVDR